jgi:ketosteroid isomerase-like protein
MSARREGCRQAIAPSARRAMVRLTGESGLPSLGRPLADDGVAAFIFETLSERADMDARAQARQTIEELVHRETRAWDEQDAAALVELFHPDTVLPWPPTEHDHDPATWIAGMGRFDRERWTRSWELLFSTHRLVHNRRQLVKVLVTDEADGGFAVVDIDTLWRDHQGRDNHWHGRVCKVYTRLHDGAWKLIMHTGVLAY